MNIFLPEQSSENVNSLAKSTEIDVVGMGAMGVPEPAQIDSNYTEYSPKETFYFTRAAIVTTTITGSMSAISSAIIIYIILRSASKLKSSYHQIMFFMSLWDIVASTAMALSTIPMPVDIMYPFEAKSYGTKQTCRAQGLLYYFGTACGLAANITLHAYYLATIRFKVKDETVKNRVLPIVFPLFTVFSVVLIAPYIWNDQINPSPYDSFCSVSAYPYCEFVIDNSSCKAGVQAPSFWGEFVALSIGGGLVFLVVAMIMIIVTVYQIEKAEIRSLRKGRDKQSQTQIRIRIREQFKTTRSIGIQSSCYFMAFVMTWMFGVIEIIRGLTSGHPDSTTNYISTLRLIFQPLQGFFSALIFVSHKIIICRRSQDMTIREALWTIFSKTSSVPEILISQVIMVAEDDFAETARQRSVMLELHLQREENCPSSKRNDPSLAEDGLSYSKHANHSSIQNSYVGGDCDGVGVHSNTNSSRNQNDLSGFGFPSSSWSGSNQKEGSDDEGISVPTSSSRQDVNSS